MTDMASKPYPPLQKTADIDTTLPFKNVQAAVRMFGEKCDHAKTIKLHEKYGVHEVDKPELKEELARARAQVAEEQKQRASVLSELNDLKKLLASSESSPCKDVGELKTANQQHGILLAELEEIKTQRNRLDQELSMALQEKESAQRQAEEALALAEENAKRAEELSKEISGTKESLLLVKMACVETNKEREALWAARNAETSKHARARSPCSSSELNKLEHKLKVGRAEFTKEDLRVIRQSLVSAREALANVDRLKAGCGSPVTDATIAIELEAAKSELSKALGSDALLESTLKELQDKFTEAKQELDSTRLELVEMRSKEATASEEIVKLKSELEKVKIELKAAVSCNEAFVGFSQKLQKESTQEGEESNRKKANDDAKAELHALLKEEAEAVRQAELRRKMSQVSCLNEKRDRLETVYEDGNMVSQDEASSLPHDVPRESTTNAVSSEVRSSYREEHRKKKFALPSFGTLLSSSKQRSRKGRGRAREDA